MEESRRGVRKDRDDKWNYLMGNMGFMEDVCMTKEQIIEVLKAAAKPYERYCIEEGVRQAMMQLPNPRELVEPILEIIGTNPNVDFGMPGDLVHYVECFYKKGYEELLFASVDNPRRAKRYPYQ